LANVSSLAGHPRLRIVAAILGHFWVAAGLRIVRLILELPGSVVKLNENPMSGNVVCFTEKFFDALGNTAD
jgi:hypothetical protein